jgi:hypothetical protein
MARLLRLLSTVLVLLAVLAPDAAAQKARVGRDWFPDTHYGYRFRYPQDWLISPVQDREKARGLIAQMDGPALSTKLPGNKVYNYPTSLMVYAFAQREAVTRDEDEGSGGLRGRIGSESGGRATIGELLPNISFGGAWRELPKLQEEEEVKVKDLVAKHEVWKGHNGDVEVIFDCWTFRLDDHDIALAYAIPEQHFDKWDNVFKGTAKTFEKIEKEESADFVGSSASYEELLAYHTDEVSRTPGWNIVEVPSQRYIIKTSSDDKKFLKSIVERIERSRDLYERDFPPDKPIENISVVRVCATEEEFHKYGKTGGGVAGWFNPRSEELVIVDFKMYDRNMTYGVTSHEAFHQYCHFLFDQSEAHRWFDEGHGDYYGAFEFKGKRAIPSIKMAGGLDRSGVIRDMMREGSWMPVAEHIRLDHANWQRGGIPSYSQSWALIYFLRQGMLGDVPGKLWEDEYGLIIPSYVRTLREGYRKAYEEIDKELETRKNENGEPLSPEEKADFRRWKVQDSKEQIWKDALEASWGQVDIDEFQENWVEYCTKHLK